MGAGTPRSEQKCGGIRRSSGRRDGDRLGVVTLTIAVAPHPVVVPRRGVLRRGVEHGGEESVESVVLTGSARGPAPVRRQHGFADVVRGVVGEVVAVLRVPDVREVRQGRLGLLEERGTATLVDRYPLQAVRRHERVDSALLRGGQRGHCHGTSPMIGTVGLFRTWVRKPLVCAISSGVMIVGLTSRATWSLTRWHAP